MTTITCKCEAVEIRFSVEAELFRHECCCYDCTAGLWYAHKRGGPAIPPHQCIDCSWLSNDFVIVRGEGKLGAFKNFENADMTRFHCSECWSVLFADHPVYEEKILVSQVVCHTDFNGFKSGPRMAPQARHFLKDLSAEQLEALPTWTGDADKLFQGPADNLLASLPDMRQRGGEGGAMNAQILLARIGGAFIPTGEARLSEGPPTLMQQMAAEEK